MKKTAFTLIEVVIALGVLAIATLALTGLLAPTRQTTSQLSDVRTANALAEELRTKLSSENYQELTATILGTNWSTPAPSGGVISDGQIFFVASRDGSRLLRTNEDSIGAFETFATSLPAENPLTNASPGIAQRDRFFHIALRRDTSVPHTHGDPVATIAEITWPFREPTAPATATEDPLTDPSRLVAAESRERRSVFVFLLP